MGVSLQCQRTVLLLNTLQQWHKHAEYSGSLHADLALSGLQAALAAYLRFVDQWISDGYVFDEWREMDTKSGCVPSLFRPCLRALQTAGEAMVMLRTAASDRGVTAAWCGHLSARSHSALWEGWGATALGVGGPLEVGTALGSHTAGASSGVHDEAHGVDGAAAVGPPKHLRLELDVLNHVLGR